MVLLAPMPNWDASKLDSTGHCCNFSIPGISAELTSGSYPRSLSPTGLFISRHTGECLNLQNPREVQGIWY